MPFGNAIVPTQAENHAFPMVFSSVPKTLKGSFSLFDGLTEFDPEYLRRVLHIDSAADSLVDVARGIFEEISKHRRFIDILSGDEVMNFPVGIRKQFSPNSHLTVGVVNARFHPLYAEVDLFARLELSELNADLFFAASGVKISHRGGIYEEAKLHLVKNFPLIRQGGQWLLTFLGDFRRNGSPSDDSYLVIDCEGTVKELSLAADVRISKKIAVPLKDNGDYAFPGELEPNNGSSPVNNKSYVGARFRVEGNTTNDFLFELSLPFFELRGLKGWGFGFKNCILDLSDTSNFPGIKFPDAYAEQGVLIRGQRELWRGFYADEVRVMLPPQFRIKSSDTRIVVGAENFILDHHGVSGEFYAESVIPLDNGNAGGWRFSVDRISAMVVGNTLTGAGFSGKLLLPLSKDREENALKYKGFISAGDEYLLDVAIEDELDFDVFRARTRLYKGSFIRMEVHEGRFYPEANLTGIMQFDPGDTSVIDTLTEKDIRKNGMEKLRIGGLLFQNLHLKTRSAPYISVEYLALKDTVATPSFFGFELGVHAVHLETPSPEKASLAFNAFINLDDTGIKGDVGLRIDASMESGDLHEWKFERFQVDSVGVEVQRNSFELSGKLHFTDADARYGDALAGRLQVYSEILKIEMGARAIFGRKDDYNYWFADVYGAPINKGGNPFKIYSLSGGIYHHMQKAGFDEAGSNPSGILYVPDAVTDFGFKALAAFEVKQKMTFSGLVGIEMSFNEKHHGGGLRRVGLYGAASLMNPAGSAAATDQNLGELKAVQRMQAERESQLSGFHELSIDRQGIQYFANEVFPDLLTGKELFAAQVAMDYDLTNEVYWGMFDSFLNLGGIRGDGEKNRLGFVEFYSAPDNWYIYAGTPEKRFGVRDIPVGPFSARANVYYMAGTKLPPPAAPPQQVQDILNLHGDQFDFNRNYDTQLASGRGYAFGATLAMGIGFDWGLVYANVEAGVGFDLMMRNFADVTCQESSGQLGMNGWYASGQAYAYLQGALGVRVDVFFMKMDIPVMKAGIALLAQAQLPNPWYIKGYAGIEVHVLGHINIRTRVKVVIGEPCEMMETTGLEAFTMISDITPLEGAEEVNVFESVHVALNTSEGEMIRVETMTGKKYFKAHLDTLVVYDGNKKLKGELLWNEGRDLLSWNAEDILPENSTLITWVRLSFLEYTNGEWVPLLKDGVPVTEEQKVTFTTGGAPASIPYANIESMFPVISQNYVLAEEFEKGYILLKKGQDYLFEKGLKNHFYFVSGNTGKKTPADFSYDRTNNLIRFTLPDLYPSTAYSVLLQSRAEPSDAVSVGMQYQEKGEALFTSSNKIDGTSSGAALFTRLEYSFHTSAYRNFKEKVRAMEIEQHSLFADGDQDVAGFALKTVNAEPWDIHDISPARYNGGQAFIRASAHMTDDYYEKEIHPFLYEHYPLDKDIRVLRDTAVYGFIPRKAVVPSTIYKELTHHGVAHRYLSDNFPFQWRLARTYKNDFYDLRSQLADRILNRDVIDYTRFEKYKYLINGTFPFVNTERYKVYFHYILPLRTTGNKIRVDYINSF
ncbi:hypothetical protein [Robertkochia flava]|uniref:hypothetical protein n=1 Tax=Robertkochia flava TaxID=3447986 RepID=UPI001CCF0E3A|nr:hypothetical protein [Robertkochia marina]